jgi:hypothetical protein
MTYYKGRYCKIYKIPPCTMVWSCWKNAKTNQFQNKLQQLQRKGKKPEKDHLKNGERRWKEM